MIFNDRHLDVLRGTMAMVPGITAELIDDAMAVLTGAKVAVAPGEGVKLAPVMKEREAAILLGVSTRQIRYHVSHGRIRAVQIPGSKKLCGVVRSDVEKILNGGV